MFSVPGLVFDGTEGVWSRFHVLRYGTPFRRYRGREVPFSRFALPDSVSAVPRASAPVFKFCVLGLIFGRAECVGSCFPVLRARSRLRRYRGRRVPFSCFAPLDSFSAVSGASHPVFMFCAPELIFGGTEGIGSRFHFFALPDSYSAVSRASGSFFTFCAPELVFGGTEVVGSFFHAFALSDMFSALPRASGTVFMFCAPGLVFGGVEGVESLFHILRA
jgi:hypothetical protein